MKKLLMLATALATLIAVTEPTFAAPRTARADQARVTQPVDQVQRDYDNYYGLPGHDSFASGEVRAQRTGPTDQFYSRFNGTYRAAPGQNLPYADRPYGDPDKD
jgi:hypothetical protein